MTAVLTRGPLRGVEVLDQAVAGGAVVTRARYGKRAMPKSPEDWWEARQRMQFMEDIDRLLVGARKHAHLTGAVPGAGFVANTGASAIALAAATAKTLLYVNGGTNIPASLSEFCVGFDGVTASAVPVLVELMGGTKASNSTPGTGSTSFTPLQMRGWAGALASGVTAANTCTSEPTVLASWKPWLVTPNGGLLIVQFPLGKEPSTHSIASTSGLQYAIRATAPAIVNVRGYEEHDE